MLIAPLLVPRSKVHACLQIIICLVLFRLCPGLLPKWYYFPLTVLAALLVTASARSGLVGFVRAERPRVPGRLDVYVKQMKRCTRGIAMCFKRAAGFAVRGLMLCVGAARYLLGSIVPFWASWLASLIRNVFNDVMLETRRLGLEGCSVMGKMRLWLWIVAGVVGRSLTSSMYTTRRNFLDGVRDVWFRRSTESARPMQLYDFQNAIDNTIATAISIVMSNLRRIAWVCLCLTHFLAFTLGLTIMFPCLCTYGFVVSFVNLVLRYGVTNLARSAMPPSQSIMYTILA